MWVPLCSLHSSLTISFDKDKGENKKKVFFLFPRRHILNSVEVNSSTAEYRTGEAARERERENGLNNIKWLTGLKVFWRRGQLFGRQGWGCRRRPTQLSPSLTPSSSQNGNSADGL